MRDRTNRWIRSEITFGPVGRIVCTILLIAPILFAVFYSAFFLIAALIWACIVPMALRDVWRGVRDPNAPPPIVLPPEAKPPRPGESIQERKLPPRW